jgi:hypothetical protein
MIRNGRLAVARRVLKLVIGNALPAVAIGTTAKHSLPLAGRQVLAELPTLAAAAGALRAAARSRRPDADHDRRQPTGRRCRLTTRGGVLPECRRGPILDGEQYVQIIQRVLGRVQRTGDCAAAGSRSSA